MAATGQPICSAAAAAVAQCGLDRDDVGMAGDLVHARIVPTAAISRREYPV
jgi:hypothetical protein